MTALLLALIACPGPVETGAPESNHTDDHTDEIDCADVDGDEDGVDSCLDCDDADPGVADCAACDEAGYWQPTRGLSTRAEVESALRGLTGVGDCDYTQSTTWMFTRLDKHDGVVECVYTGRTTPVSSDKPDPDDMNTEHTWPRSDGADVEPALCDLHHLFPTDADANSTRANHPLGEVVREVRWSRGGSSLGEDSGGNPVFEPRDVHKGDAARALLYVAMRYGAGLSGAQRALYGQWHEADPPDAAEVERTVDIGAWQGHPNPYVVCPHLVEAVSR